MTSTTQTRPLGDIPDAFIALLQAQAKFGQQLFTNLTGTSAPSADTLTNAWQTAATQWPMPAMPKPACYVPPPCWMPRSLGECVSYVSNCSTAKVRIVVTNCDRVARTVQVRIDGAGGITVTPPSQSLNPMARATFDVSLAIPEGTDSGKQFDALIWVDGCNQHYLRWTVIVGSAAFDSCHQVRVDDCPDYRHHWYDHFYCVRACRNPGNTPNG
jgi:hypothetical protein